MSRPIVPSLLQIGISDDDAHTRATSSMTMQAATESPPSPAVLLRDVDGGEAGRRQRRQSLIGVPGLLVDVGGVWGDLLFAQVTQHRAQLVVLVGELENVKRRVTDGHGDSLLLARFRAQG